MRSPAPSQWAIILPWRSRSCDVVAAVAASVITSGMQTIVTSSTAARPPMPLRRATSPSKSVALTSSPPTLGAESVYVPAAGRASGRPAASVILISLEAALTFVARFWRPFLSVRPSYSSLPSVPASTTSL